MPSIKLASQRMSTGGSPGGLSPVLLSSQPGGAVQATQVNPASANTRWTNQAVQDIVPDETISQLGAAAETMTKAAFEYQDRVSSAEADQRLLNLDARLKEAHTALASKEGEEGVKAYASFEGVVKSSMQDVLADAPEAVRAKMALGVHRAGNEYLSSGARHRVKQQSVWEQNIFDNKMTGARNEMLAQSSEPQEFIKNLNIGLAAIDAQYAGQPEVATKLKKAMTDDAFLSAAEMQADLGDYVKALDYVVEGEGEYGVDAGKTAQAYDSISRKIIAEGNRQRVLDSQAAQDDKDFRAAQNKAILQQADMDGNRALLDAILDPVDKAKYLAVYDKIRTDPPSSVKGLVEVEAIAHTAYANPADLYDYPFVNHVAMKDIKTVVNRLEADNKAGRTAQILSAKEFVETTIQLPDNMLMIKGMSGDDIMGLSDAKSDELMAAARLKGYGTIMDAQAGIPVMERAIKNSQAQWYGKAVEAIRASKDNPNETPEMALLKVKSEMMESFQGTGLNWQNSKDINVPYEAIHPIDKMPMHTGGMMEAVRHVGTPEAYDRVQVYELYEDSTLDLMLKYGATVDEIRNMGGEWGDDTLGGLLISLASDPVLRQQAMRDIFQLKLQRQFLIQNESPTGNVKKPNAGPATGTSTTSGQDKGQTNAK